MAEEGQGFGSASTGLITGALAVLAAALYGHSLFLRDNRPTIPATSMQSGGTQQIDARLWEDPLYAAQRFRAAETSRPAHEAPKSTPPFSVSVQITIPPTPNKAAPQATNGPFVLQAAGKTADAEATHDQGGTWPCVTGQTAAAAYPPLVVLIPGGPYEQAAETRRRTRYAVISALHTEGYDTVDPEHLGCFAAPQGAPGPRGDAAATQGQAPVIPFERFVKQPIPGEQSDGRASPPDGQAVLWVDEDQLRDDPKPHDGLSAIVAAYRTHFGAPDGSASVRVIGPYSSKILELMQNAPCDTTQSFDFFVYGATFKPDATVKPEGPVGRCATRTYQQVVNTDDVLARAIRSEIDLRPRRNGRIALIGEFDTVYGRSLCLSVAKAFSDTCNEPKPGAGGAAHRVDLLTYMRGLDGSLPRLDGALESGNVASNAAVAPRAETVPTMPAPAYETAEGNAQLDYLERLPNPLKQMERQGSAPYAAIGLLGNDVYDKLLLLRALRPRFPHAVFFTTDLDARLFDPGEFRTTRGLIVASSFGLTFPPVLQAHTPPFRDSYQAAAFLATRATFKNGAGGKIVDCLKAWHGAAGLFEIGRWGAVTLKSAAPPVACKPLDIWGPPTADPGPFGLTATQKAGIWVFAFGAWFLLAYEFRLYRQILTTILVTLALVAALLAAGVGPGGAWARGFLTESGDGEPLSLTNGISLWPVVGLRIVGAIFCWYAVGRVRRKLRDNGALLARKFALLTPRTRPVWSMLRETTATFFVGVLLAPHDPITNGQGQPVACGGNIYDRFCVPYTSVGCLWWRLCPPSTIPRLLRAAIYCALSLLITGVLALIFGAPTIPGRGWLIGWFYWLSTGANVILMQYLVCLVLDATIFSSHFTRQLKWLDDSKYELSIRNRYSEQTGLRHGPLLSDWIDMKMIAARTDSIIETVYFPFIALSIFVFSETAIFDDVPIYLPLFALAAGGFGLLIFIAMQLRREAERVRKNAIRHCETAILTAKTASLASGHLEAWLQRLTEYRAGAFKPFRQQPLLRAVLLPLSSLGGSAILQQLL